MAATGHTFRCQHCYHRYSSLYVHPNRGPVCPGCLLAPGLAGMRIKGLPVARRKNRVAAREPKASDWLSIEPGHQLGHGMPMGTTLRYDGESHRAAWMRIMRADPCAYCGTVIHYDQGMGVSRWGAGTVDHIVPQNPRVSYGGLGGKWDWPNMAGACGPCNTSKNDLPLLEFLHKRVMALPRKKNSCRGLDIGL